MRALCIVTVIAAGCGNAEQALPATAGAAPAPARATARPHAAEIAALRAHENRVRNATDFATLPPSSETMGPDPYALVTVSAERAVGLLRGANAVVLLDAEARELHRVPAPASPTGIAVGPSGELYVVGELASEIARYRVAGDRLDRLDPIALPGVLGAHDVAVGDDGTAYVIEQYTGRLLAVSAGGVAEPRELGRCHGPISVDRAGDYLIEDCLLDHAIELRRLDALDRVQRIVHDGPIWAATARAGAGDGELRVTVTGVEDHPLDRSDGSFGYIDSFAFQYRVGAGDPERIAALDLSELGLVTPKWLGRTGDAVVISGYGGEALAKVAFGERGELRETHTDSVPPGLTAITELGDREIAADPLLDAWVVLRNGAPEVVPIPDPRPPRPAEVRVGEALFFTGLMAPFNVATGRHSRFTCETCHYEGYVDGRVHFTGRDHVYSATRPLLGLFNNRPHFSRALDRSMAQMVNNEFHVANLGNGHDPWFALAAADYPWLKWLGDVPDRLSPMFLRRSLMAFLMTFSHRPNPAVLGRTHFSALERAGARAFHGDCERCHAARLVTDQPASAVPFDSWEALVFAPAGAIVWASAERRRTGVTPYVHPEGARPPTLRRLYKKWPYFTNGSAKTLDDVLARARFAGDEFYHDAAPAGARALPADEQRAIRAFLDLL